MDESLPDLAAPATMLSQPSGSIRNLRSIPEIRAFHAMGIHPTAVIAQGAKIGADVEIGPYCVVGPKARIGDRCRLQSHVVVEGDTWVGADCDVFPFAALGTRPQDKKVTGSTDHGKLRIGARNKIREHVTIHGGTEHGRGTTIVGDDNMLLVGSHVGHDASIGSRIVLTNGAMAAGHTTLGDKVILGAMVGIHQFARVGRLAMLGAGSMLSHDAPPFALVQGDRARLVGVNLVGLHRAGVSPDDAAVVKRAFRLLFWRHGRLAERIDAVRRDPVGPHPLVQELLEFVSLSRRGVCMPRGGRLVVETEQEPMRRMPVSGFEPS